MTECLIFLKSKITYYDDTSYFKSISSKYSYFEKKCLLYSKKDLRYCMIVVFMQECFIIEIWKFIPLEKSGDVFWNCAFFQGGGGNKSLYLPWSCNKSIKQTFWSKSVGKDRIWPPVVCCTFVCLFPCLKIIFTSSLEQLGQISFN